MFNMCNAREIDNITEPKNPINLCQTIIMKILGNIRLIKKGAQKKDEISYFLNENIIKYHKRININ